MKKRGRPRKTPELTPQPTISLLPGALQHAASFASLTSMSSADVGSFGRSSLPVFLQSTVPLEPRKMMQLLSPIRRHSLSLQHGSICRCFSVTIERPRKWRRTATQLRTISGAILAVEIWDTGAF
jgi:hypothetical protein